MGKNIRKVMGKKIVNPNVSLAEAIRRKDKKLVDKISKKAEEGKIVRLF